jgi:hypothetical protein
MSVMRRQVVNHYDETVGELRSKQKDGDIYHRRPEQLLKALL